VKRKGDGSVNGSVWKWIREILTGVIERLTGGTPGKKKRSLRNVFIITALSLIVPATFPIILKLVMELKREHDVHKMQDAVTQLEKTVEAACTSITVSESKQFRNCDYIEKATGEKIVSDVWEEGQLNYRNFFAHGKIVCRDCFHYKDGKAIGKRREYFDNGVKVMTEEFSQTGVLLSKRHCSKTEPGDCRDYMRDYRSPLPPGSYAFYR
jgi:hypothetical protein